MKYSLWEAELVYPNSKCLVLLIPKIIKDENPFQESGRKSKSIHTLQNLWPIVESKTLVEHTKNKSSRGVLVVSIRNQIMSVLSGLPNVLW